MSAVTQVAEFKIEIKGGGDPPPILTKTTKLQPELRTSANVTEPSLPPVVSSSSLPAPPAVKDKQQAAAPAAIKPIEKALSEFTISIKGGDAASPSPPPAPAPLPQTTQIAAAPGKSARGGSKAKGKRGGGGTEESSLSSGLDSGAREKSGASATAHPASALKDGGGGGGRGGAKADVQRRADAFRDSIKDSSSSTIVNKYTPTTSTVRNDRSGGRSGTDPRDTRGGQPRGADKNRGPPARAPHSASARMNAPNTALSAVTENTTATTATSTAPSTYVPTSGQRKTNVWADMSDDED